MNQMERNGEAAKTNGPEGAVTLEEEPSSQTQAETKDVSANFISSQVPASINVFAIAIMDKLMTAV